MTSEWYDLEYAVIHANSFGKGRPLFLLPGWACSSTKVCGALEPYLADRYRVTSIDLPGWAGQSKFKTDGEAAVARYVEVVRDSLNAIYSDNTVVDIGGVSAGGTLALLAAYDVGSKIGKIVVQSSPYEGFIICGSKRLGAVLMNALRFAPCLKFVLREYYRGSYTWFAGKRGVDIDIDEALKDYEGLQSGVVLDFARDLLHSSYSNLLRTVKNRVIVIGCEKDRVVPPEMMKKLSKDALPNAKYYEIEGGAHHILAENPQKLAQIIIDNV